MKALRGIFGLALFIALALPGVSFAQTATAALVASPPSGTVPLTVTFTGDTGKGCAGGNFSIVYGDGQTQAFAQPADRCRGDFTFTHKYSVAGSYTAQITSGSTVLKTTMVAVSSATAGKIPPTCFITVTPTSINVGGTVTVRWSSTNATAGAITNVGNVGPSGSIQLLPSSAARTTYLGSFTGPGGTANCQGFVTVVTSGGTGSGEGTGSTPSVPPTVVTPAPTAALTSPTIVGSGLVPCGYGAFTGGSEGSSSTGCQACHLATLIQNVINFAIGLSIPLAAALFAWAGVLFFTSADSPGQRDQAKKIFKNAFIGFLIAITAWLVVNTVLHVIFSGNSSINGTWFTIKCADSTRPINNKITDVITNLPVVGGGTIATDGTPGSGTNSTGGDSNPGGGSNGVYSCPAGTTLSVMDAGTNNEYNSCVGSGGTEVAVQCNASAGYHLANTSDINSNSYSGECADQNNQIVDYEPTRNMSSGGATGGVVDPGNIASAATAYMGTNTSAGPDGGNLACAWAVNNVLKSAGIAPVDGNSVDEMETALENGRGVEVENQSNARAGDLVIQNNDVMSHVGICQNDGCTRVLSNSSGRASFTNVSDVTMGAGIAPTIYRVIK
jgi:hypothetical protein